MKLRINPTHEAADAFWKYWKENNGESYHHGYYESTWGAINAALNVAGLAPPEGPPWTMEMVQIATKMAKSGFVHGKDWVFKYDEPHPETKPGDE